MISVLVGVRRDLEFAMEEAGMVIPPRKSVKCLIDTGPTKTILDPVLLQEFGQIPTGKVFITTPSTDDEPLAVQLFDVSLAIVNDVGDAVLDLKSIAVIERPILAHQGFHGLLGMDVLQKIRLVLDGPAGEFSVSG